MYNRITVFGKKESFYVVLFLLEVQIYTGLPYDMGFFALITELVYKDIKERLPEEKTANLKLGYVTMKTNFTQIYDKTRDLALMLLQRTKVNINQDDRMPTIENAQEMLEDIYKQTDNTSIMKWIRQHAELRSNE